MTVKAFFIGLIISFAFPWLAVVALPYAKMRAIETPQFIAEDQSETPYHPVKSGRGTNGSYVYGQEGCAMCHSQVARPTYAGNDLGREGLAGFKKDPKRGNTIRECNVWDYDREPYAWIGETRMGPDLGNFGRRMEVWGRQLTEERAEALGKTVEELPLEEKVAIQRKVYIAVLLHLYDPRMENKDSICPSNKSMFKRIPLYGQKYDFALPVELAEKEVVPKDKALALASYLLGLKRDGEVPKSMDSNLATTKKIGE